MENIIFSPIPLNLLIEKLLEGLEEKQKHFAKEKQQNADSSEWLNTEQAAKYLNIAESTLYAMTAKKGISFHKTGRKNLFLKSDLDNYLRGRKQKTQAEIQAEAQNYMKNAKGGKNGK